MERRHEITRLEAFSDAVFAFALTLLVVSLEVPKNSAELSNLVRGFLPFALMFAMICWIWYEHQKFFRKFDLQSPAANALNCLLLFVVLFYVYPLKYLTIRLIGPFVGMLNPETHLPFDGNIENGDMVLALYSTGVVLIFGTFVALYRLAWKHREALELSPEDRMRLKSDLTAHAISAAFGVVSIAIVGIARATKKYELAIAAGFVYALMGPAHGWHGAYWGKRLKALRKKSGSDAQR